MEILSIFMLIDLGSGAMSIFGFHKKSQIRINNREVDAVEATIILEFENHLIFHDVYWASNGEIFPQKNGKSFDDIMNDFYPNKAKSPFLQVGDVSLLLNSMFYHLIP